MQRNRDTEEPGALIALVRVCGGAVRVTCGSTRNLQILTSGGYRPAGMGTTTSFGGVWPLLLIHRLDDPLATEDYEREIHDAVPGSQYVTLQQAGHFPMAEQPQTVNRAIRIFWDML